MSESALVSQSVGRSVGWMVGWSVGRSVGQSVSKLDSSTQSSLAHFVSVQFYLVQLFRSVWFSSVQIAAQ